MCFKHRLIIAAVQSVKKPVDRHNDFVWKWSVLFGSLQAQPKDRVIVIFKPKCSFNRDNVSPIDRFTKLVIYVFISIV